MKKVLFALVAIIGGLFVADAQTIELINLEKALSQKKETATNGYAKKISGEDIEYNNLWNTRSAAFLTRATTGKMTIEWMSDPVKTIKDGYAELVMLVCLDQGNPPRKFDFYADNVLCGTISNFHEKGLKKEEPSGVKFEFLPISRNAWGDASFFMSVLLPEKYVALGKPVQLKMVGEHAQSNAWFMVFKNKELLEEVAMRADTDNCFEVTADEKTNSVRVIAPLCYAGKNAIVANGTTKRTVKFTTDQTAAVLELKEVLPLQAFSVTVEGKRLFLIDSDFKTATRLIGYTLEKTVAEQSGALNRYLIMNQHSSAKDDMIAISQSPLKDAKVYIMVSSHQDIGWMDTPYRCIEDRDKLIISPAIALLEKHPDYRYDIEDALMLEEYLERHPSKRPLIERLIKNGQLGIGASYTQPYEEMQTGESLVRQFYYGKRWLSKMFDGYNARTYWNVDVPGRTLQMPQILKKSGVRAIQYSRHERGIYEWFSPDSSSVTVFTPGHYTVASQFLRKTPEEGLEKFKEYIESFPDYRSEKGKPAVVGMLSAEDMSEAHTYYNWMDKFKAFSDTIAAPMPELIHSTSDMFVEAFEKEKPVLPKIVGERPDLWLYIHGPTHERALTAFRSANRGAVAAETFSTIAALLKKDFSDYPKQELDQVWKDIIYADHGWGGNGGNVTDSLFRARYENADRESAKLVRKATEYIASSIRTDKKSGVPVVVFNPLSIVYSAPVEVTVESDVSDFSLLDGVGNPVAYQVLKKEGKRYVIEFVAENLPSVGYATFYVNQKPAKKPFAPIAPLENDYYKVEMNEGRLVQIVDKEIGKALFDTGKFEVGEIFTMQSVGNGAGEFATMQLPSMQEFDKTSAHDARWSLVQDGAVFALYRSETKFADADVVRYMKIYKTIKRIDFPSEINNFSGRNYREFRQAFPLRAKGEVAYDVPFGTVTVGKDEMKGAAGERYMDVCSTIHPRGISNWFGAKCDGVDVKLSSSVVVVDYIDPTENPVDNTVLQPILLASRRSCHWLGEFYSQRGDHSYNFTLNSADAKDGMAALRSVAANYRPVTVYAPRAFADASMPDHGSFFALNNGNGMVSTIKKCEDDNGVVVRVYDPLGEGNQSVSIQSMFFTIAAMEQTDLLEQNPLPIQNPVNLKNRSVETIKLHLK